MTFLFLVSVAASTLLLLAIATGEVLVATRRLLTRWVAEQEAVDAEDLRYHEQLARLSEVPAAPSRAQLPRPAVRELPAGREGDWVPDRAA